MAHAIMGYGQDTCTILLVLVLVSELFSLLFFAQTTTGEPDALIRYVCTAVGDKRPTCLLTNVRPIGGVIAPVGARERKRKNKEILFHLPLANERNERDSGRYYRSSISKSREASEPRAGL